MEDFNCENTTPLSPLEGHNNSSKDCQWESAQLVEQGETFLPQDDQQQRPDATDRDKGFGQSWYAADQQQTTAFRENPILGSRYVPTVGGSYAVTLESNCGLSQEKDDWWPPAMQLQEEQDSALEELQAIASALEETYNQVPDNCTTENPHNSEVEGHINILDQDIPRMKLLF